MEYWKEITTIIAAFISAVALVKVNRIDNQDRVRRALWAMEQYLIMAGKCLENPSVENKESYTSVYMLMNLYMAKELKEDIIKTDNFIRKNEMDKARESILDLTNKYSKKYKMDIYAPRQRHFIRK